MSGDITVSFRLWRRPRVRQGGRYLVGPVRSGREFAVTVPPREYELAARLLAQAVESDRGGASRAALDDAARQFGAELGRRSVASSAQGGARQAMDKALREHGFEPCQDQDGRLAA